MVHTPRDFVSCRCGAMYRGQVTEEAGGLLDANFGIDSKAAECFMKSPGFAKRQYVKRLEVAIRRHVPPRCWTLAVAFERAASRSLVEILAAVAAAPFKALPDRVSLALREKLTLWRNLDYDRALITMRATTRKEQKTRLRSCAREPETVAWIHQTIKPGDVLYDIGANVGAYSLVAASWTKEQAIVYAFEPGCFTFPSLVENIFANKFEQSVIPFQVALSDQTTLVKFGYSTLDAGGATHVGIRDMKGSMPTVRKQVLLSYRLDDFIQTFGLRLPTHMKIDVDGSELEVLRGAKGVLGSSCLQWILVEVDARESDPQAVRTLLEEDGFRLERDHPHTNIHNWVFRRESEAETLIFNG